MFGSTRKIANKSVRHTARQTAAWSYTLINMGGNKPDGEARATLPWVKCHFPARGKTSVVKGETALG